jgi:hypothetical protein
MHVSGGDEFRRKLEACFKDNSKSDLYTTREAPMIGKSHHEKKSHHGKKYAKGGHVCHEDEYETKHYKKSPKRGYRNSHEHAEHAFFGGLLGRATNFAKKAAGTAMNAAGTAMNTANNIASKGNQFANQARGALNQAQTVGNHFGAHANQLAGHLNNVLDQAEASGLGGKYISGARNALNQAQKMGNQYGAVANQMAGLTHAGLNQAQTMGNHMHGQMNQMHNQFNGTLGHPDETAIAHKRGGRVKKMAMGGIGKQRHEALPRTGGSLNARFADRNGYMG